jgi:hypothetical protein
MAPSEVAVRIAGVHSTLLLPPRNAAALVENAGLSRTRRVDRPATGLPLSRTRGHVAGPESAAPGLYGAVDEMFEMTAFTNHWLHRRPSRTALSLLL